MIEPTDAPLSGDASRKAYYRAYYLANREKKIAAAKESYYRRKALGATTKRVSPTRSIGTIIARIDAELARWQAKWGLKHENGCLYWLRFEPLECSCKARPVIDLLVYIAQRKAA